MDRDAAHDARDRVGQNTQRFGQFEMRVEAAEPTQQSTERWHSRVDVLAAWLLSEWQRRLREAA